MTKLTKAAFVVMLLTSCASFTAYERARTAEQSRRWDTAVEEYEKALLIDPDNSRYRLALDRARREASREHFEKGKSLQAATTSSSGSEQVRLMQLAATELQIAVKLDPTNQYAAVQMGKAFQFLQEAARAANEGITIDDIKKRVAKSSITKAKPPQLNPASSEPISLSFPRETPVKDIYRALGNAFGINILFDQAVKDDRIAIELRDVTAQQALERVMQAANHFYKVLDEKTIIVVPDNPQARRDYEDLVIQTFYLSNGDAEQVTNVVRTMIEARNVFPLKALNAITIRDTADKVRIAEKIIQANDKAKAEVVVAVELVQLDINKLRDIGISIQGPAASSAGSIVPNITGADGKSIPLTGGTQVTLDQLRSLGNGSFTFSIPSVTYTLIKNLGNSELLANPELRISEGEKATLHIGQRIPVPVSTFTAISTGTSPYQPVVSYQYQDVGIKVSMEPRVHHNREVTLKLTVEVSNQGPPVEVPNQAPQPTFATRTIESTIRLKDGETNFLAGLIQSNKEESNARTPFLGDIPFLGRLFNRQHQGETRTDLVLTMTPHIIRIADITDDDLAPMWVGTTNNLTFRGVTPRIESQTAIDPFSNPNRSQYMPRTLVQAVTDQQGNPPPPAQQPAFAPPPGTGPSDPFQKPKTPQSPQADGSDSSSSKLTVASESAISDDAARRLAPRISPQPTTLAMKAGDHTMWTVVGMDLDGLSTDRMSFRYDPHALRVEEVMFGPAMNIDPKTPPVVTIDGNGGVVKIVSSDGKPLGFRSGGEVLILRLQGILTGDAALVLDALELKNDQGQLVVGAISGGRARVQ
ncbi:MAG TPA: secretin N-terminal domain-containing protein [Thermoanaerobaculia bacterium]|jgi:general secretion pathway protein D|nr:secretin N-terminal domain-containing protein [Thermoanaerobaculia bacterium]